MRSISLSDDEYHLIRYILVRYLKLLIYTQESWKIYPNVISSLSEKFSDF